MVNVHELEKRTFCANDSPTKKKGTIIFVCACFIEFPIKPHFRTPQKYHRTQGMEGFSVSHLDDVEVVLHPFAVLCKTPVFELAARPLPRLSIFSLAPSGPCLPPCA